MFNLARRNIRIYFRQKSAVFMSLLGVLIIIGIYAVFLGNVWTGNFPDLQAVEQLLDSWIVAGIVSVASITTAMGAAGIMVEDHSQKITKDFYAAPLKRYQIVGGYVLAIFVIGSIMSLLSLIAGEIFILVRGGSLIPFLDLVKMLGILSASVLSSSALVFFIISFIKNMAAFSTASTLIGTLVGFLTGIYLPIGSLPETVQWIVKLFPVSHAAALLRQVLMTQTIATSFDGLPEQALTEFKTAVGVTFSYGDATATPIVHLLVLAGTAILFFGLAMLNIRKKEK